jgi:methionyl-tRNA formyltransferase
MPTWCEKNGVKTHTWSKQFIHDGNFDIGIVVSFGHFIPKKLIDSFPKQMINMHGGLLPQYRYLVV